MPILLGIVAAALTYLLLRGYTQASPRALAKAIRFGGGLLAALIGGLLVLRGAIAPGLAILGFGLWLIDFSSLTARGFRPAGRGGAGVARVRTAIIEMELDRATGAIHGTVLAGPQEGMPFDQLTRSQLMSLYEFCLTDDPQGARLLEAYFDRRFAGWRQAQERSGDSRSGARRRHSISEDEAYEILGLKKGAPASEIARAHRDLMKKLHPDHGGTTDLAARVNEAKEVLMRGLQG